MNCVSEFYMLLPPFCGSHFFNVCYFVIIISSFFVLSLKSTNIIFSFLSFSFHFECVG